VYLCLSVADLYVEIERILPGGVGLAHAEGRTIFVSLAAPVDAVRVRVERARGKVAFASIVEIIKPSPLRVEPPCPYFGRCGGCDFQQLNYESQLKAKVEIINDCLHRITRLDLVPEINIHPSPHEWRYRARANWQFDLQTRALGYFERGSHRVCDVAECAVLVPELETTLEELRAEIKVGSKGLDFGEINAVAGDDGISLSPVFGSSNERYPVATAPDIDYVRVVSRNIGSETYYFSANAFFQTNHALLEALIHAAVKGAHGSTAIDLYCGVGLFTLPLARRFDQVIGVESNRTSTEFARRNLEHANLSNAQVIPAHVDEWLQANASPNSPSPPDVDLLLLDPPRMGAEPTVIEGIIALKPKQIGYVSCDPATLARDLKPLLATGYSLESVAAFDMFPQTHHVETVVRLRA
jgi:23S rRNA (uracil1939-C5)-methyltransferase